MATKNTTKSVIVSEAASAEIKKAGYAAKAAAKAAEFSLAPASEKKVVRAKPAAKKERAPKVVEVTPAEPTPVDPTASVDQIPVVEPTIEETLEALLASAQAEANDDILKAAAETAKEIAGVNKSIDATKGALEAEIANYKAMIDRAEERDIQANALNALNAKIEALPESYRGKVRESDAYRILAEKASDGVPPTSDLKAALESAKLFSHSNIDGMKKKLVALMTAQQERADALNRMDGAEKDTRLIDGSVLVNGNMPVWAFRETTIEDALDALEIAGADMDNQYVWRVSPDGKLVSSSNGGIAGEKEFIAALKEFKRRFGSKEFKGQYLRRADFCAMAHVSERPVKKNITIK